jgi:hypothetical protein
VLETSLFFNYENLCGMRKEDIVAEALRIASEGDVSSAIDRAVFFSNARNRKAAIEFCRKNPDHKTILHLDMYKQLEPLNLFGKDSVFDIEEAVDITALISARFAQAASGNVLMFYDKVSSRSTFFTLELPALIKNPNVTTINGASKDVWKDYVHEPILPRTALVAPEKLEFRL